MIVYDTNNVIKGMKNLEVCVNLFIVIDMYI